jgi:NAD(P)-dependent dehydrogenase (short-subunit alcohol dehydrogenase family)
MKAISSAYFNILGLFSTPRQIASMSAKFAVRGFTRLLGARTNWKTPMCRLCVHPGGINTNINTAGRMGSAGDFETA